MNSQTGIMLNELRIRFEGISDYPLTMVTDSLHIFYQNELVKHSIEDSNSKLKKSKIYFKVYFLIEDYINNRDTIFVHTNGFLRNEVAPIDIGTLVLTKRKEDQKLFPRDLVKE